MSEFISRILKFPVKHGVTKIHVEDCWSIDVQSFSLDGVGKPCVYCEVSRVKDSKYPEAREKLVRVVLTGEEWPTDNWQFHSTLKTDGFVLHLLEYNDYGDPYE